MTRALFSPGHVLCAVDVKNAPRGPLAMASILAETFSGSLDGLHTVAPTVAWRSRIERVQRLIVEHNAREHLEALLAPFAASLDVESFVTRGSASAVILEHARLREADLIVLGSEHGVLRNRGEHAVVPRVAAEANCAVLTVPGDSPACALRRILLPVTTAGSPDAAIDWAIALASRFGSQVTVVRVCPSRRRFWSVLTDPKAPEAPASAARRLDAVVEQTLERLRAARIAHVECAARESDAVGVSELAFKLDYDVVIVGLVPPLGPNGAAQELLARLRSGPVISTLSVRESGARPSAPRTYARALRDCELRASA